MTDHAPQPGETAWQPSFAADGRLILALAISDYDHVRDLMTGVVRPQGIELLPLSLSIEEIFHRFTRYREWEVSEMSMAKYSSLVSQGDPGLSAIPVFPSRVFRHSSIYIRRGGAVREPSDLRGKRVGLPEWAQTAAVYSRGLLTEEYGIPLQDIEWIQAGVNEPGRVEKVALKLPEGVRCRPRPDSSLDQMLRGGEVDAVLSAHAPQSFEDGNPDIVRLFPDYRPLEEAYYRKTGIFPIMHTVVLRRDVYEKNPWIARALYTGFRAAKNLCLARYSSNTFNNHTIFGLPWITPHVVSVQAEMGKDWWPYGVAANRKVLDAFLKYHHEQGLSQRLHTPEEMFVRETMEEDDAAEPGQAIPVAIWQER
jgi:4,5-dihydroxyphthalate decarboxylase